MSMFLLEFFAELQQINRSKSKIKILLSSRFYNLNCDLL